MLPAEGRAFENKDELVDMKYEEFKNFDIVNDSSNNLYSADTFKYPPVNKPSKDWVKKIQKEWMILKDNLPEGIFVRVYEERMDLLRAAIVGSAGTPYHNGLFFFDAYFPENYPLVPPRLWYHAHGLSINPNFYQSGTVCISLINTWTGNESEVWNSSKSTILQVLISIQALVLNQEPYYNEPFAIQFWSKLSSDYTKRVFLLSFQTMLYNMKKPPHHFEALVDLHFRRNGRKILAALVAYIGGAQVGCAVEASQLDVHVVGKGYSTFPSWSRNSMKMLLDKLLVEFSAKGVDCDDFRQIKDYLDSWEEEYGSSFWRKLFCGLLDQVWL